MKCNIYHTYVITIQDAILIAKVVVKSAKKIDRNFSRYNGKITEIWSKYNILLKYN